MTMHVMKISQHKLYLIFCVRVKILFSCKEGRTH